MKAEPLAAPPRARIALDDTRWQAVVERDAGADGDFVYAVRTTGVFCRPSCPARRPRRDNISFFDGAGSALAAGYLPCKRCRPEAPSSQDTWNARIIAACRAIEHSTVAPSLGELASAAGLSAAHFQRTFKAATGLSPKGFHKAVQTQRLATSLQSAASVTAALYDAGFGSAGRFYEGARALLGMAPRSYRRHGEGEHIRYAVEPCSLGWVIVAATRRGVCAIEFGDAAQTLVERIRTRFHAAGFETGDVEFGGWIRQVLRYVEQPRGVLALPLDLQGTVFQHRVWQVLQAIPAGQTASYSEIAARLGQPRACRAVARACAANPVAVAIPCHRAIRANGDLAGYRWGTARKAALLRRESED